MTSSGRQSLALRCRPWMGVVALLACAVASSQPSTVTERFRQEKAACEAGRTGQDRSTCLREAAAAYAEARRGELGNDRSAPDYARNALQRCQGLPAAQRPSCERLARGDGSRSGSVAGGGVLKTLVEREEASGPAATASGALPR